MAFPTHLQSNFSSTNLTAYTFSAENLGTEDTLRDIIVLVSGREVGGGSATVSTLTVGGVTATAGVQFQADGDQLAIYSVRVPTGTTGDVVVTWSTGMTDCFIDLFRAINMTSKTPTDTGTSTANPLTYAIDVVAGGFAIGIAKCRAGTASATWTNLTEAVDQEEGSGNDITTASAGFATTQTNLSVTCTWTTSTLPKMAVASYGLTDVPVAKSGNLLMMGV